MRWLFNHGITPEELYTNTPKSIIDRKWRWFIKYYGSTGSYEEAISDPFKYCIGLLMNKILDERVRFKMPVLMEAYIDFEIVNEDKFEQHRQWGRFQEIDFIGSDFTGYALRYYYKGKAYQKSNQLYPGGDLKKKFIENINNGIKYYSTKDITIKDFIDDVHTKFSKLTKSEIEKLLKFGFRRMHSAIRYGCAITINTRKFTNCYIHIGNLYADPAKQLKEYSLRRDRKLRKISTWLRPEYDGYYYIGLHPRIFLKWLELNKSSRTLVRFERISPRKIMKELFYKFKEAYIFRINVEKFKGWIHWSEKITARDVMYMGKIENLVFTPADKTWKELIQTYEARDNECISSRT